MTPSSDNLIKSYDYVYSSTALKDITDWKDLLTEYDGEAIEYDAIGNPTTYRGKTMIWNGRELAGFYDSETAAAYTYDASGIRTSKLHYGEIYNYYYVEGKLMSESCSQYDLIYTYDSNGNLSGIKKYLADGTEEKYGAVCNIFGDVIALYNSSGTLIAQYNYDTWGKLISITNASGTDISGTAGIWTQNSIRYRGYVYDNETGWYYLQSRYYDPDTCRFINADGMIAETSNFAINLFAYGACNPLVNVDPTGCFSMSSLVNFYETSVNFVNAVDEYSTRQYEKNALETFDNILSITENEVISHYDDIINSIIQNASLGLNSSLDDIYKALGLISDSFGLVSLLVDSISIIWDYNTYKDDMDSFWTSTNISIVTTGISIIATATIAACEWPITTTFVVTSVVVAGISWLEEKMRKKFLND